VIVPWFEEKEKGLSALQKRNSTPGTGKKKKKEKKEPRSKERERVPCSWRERFSRGGKGKKVDVSNTNGRKKGKEGSLRGGVAAPCLPRKKGALVSFSRQNRGEGVLALASEGGKAQRLPPSKDRESVQRGGPGINRPQLHL